MMDSTTDEAFEALLRYMRDSRGFDFTGYQRTSLTRRVRQASGVVVIALPVGVLIDAVVDEVTGFVLSPENPRGLAATLRSVLSQRFPALPGTGLRSTC
jgi:glycosyltransferase involved in cell wall biosynthesis